MGLFRKMLSRQWQGNETALQSLGGARAKSSKEKNTRLRLSNLPPPSPI